MPISFISAPFSDEAFAAPYNPPLSEEGYKAISQKLKTIESKPLTTEKAEDLLYSRIKKYTLF